MINNSTVCPKCGYGPTYHNGDGACPIVFQGPAYENKNYEKLLQFVKYIAEGYTTNDGRFHYQRQETIFKMANDLIKELEANENNNR